MIKALNPTSVLAGERGRRPSVRKGEDTGVNSGRSALGKVFSRSNTGASRSYILTSLPATT